MTTATDRPRSAVSAIIVDKGKILLVKRGCEPNKGLWSLPGGSVELGETARDALAREVLEETSLVVRVGDVAAVQDVIARDGPRITYHYVIVNFYAQVVSGELEARTDAEDARWVKLSELADYPTTAGLAERIASLGLI